MTAEYGPFARRAFTSADFADDKPVAAAEPRSFAAPEDEFRAEERTLSATAEDTMFPGAPLYVRKPRKKNVGAVIPKAAMIAVPAVVLAAGAIYLMSRPSSDGLFAESAVPATSPPAATALPAAPPAAPMAQEAAPIQQASTPPAPAVEPAASAPRAPVRTAAARVPSVPPAVSADDPQTWASDASATMPAAPIPYSALSQTPAPSVADAPPPLLTPEPAPEAATATPVPATPDPAQASTPAPAAQESMEEPTP